MSEPMVTITVPRHMLLGAVEGLERAGHDLKADAFKAAISIADNKEHLIPAQSGDVSLLKSVADRVGGKPGFMEAAEGLRRIARDLDMNRTYGMPWLAQQVWDERLDADEIVSILRYHPLIHDLHRVNGSVSRPTTAEDLKIVQRLLTSAQVGSCTCGTKTPDIEHHEETCTYRLAVEAAHFVTLMQENEGGVRASILPEEAFDALSDDAKWVAAAWFAYMRPDATGLSFTYETTTPTARAVRGLNELVEKGMISEAREPNASPVKCMITYKPLVDLGLAIGWALSLSEDHEVFKEKLVEPIYEDVPMQKGIATFLIARDVIR